MRKEYHQALRQEVEKIYGKKVVAYADCLQLTKEIAQRTGFRLNVNTIRRFFGVVQATYPPSLTTMEIMAQYAGFRSFEHFSERQRVVAKKEEPTPFLFLDYVSILFEKVSANNFNDPTWISIVRETIVYLEKHPQFVDDFQRMAARTTVGLDIYFEQFVNKDDLNGAYGNGLRYYLSAKSTPEANLFGNALLALRCFLTEDSEGLEMHYKKVVNHPPDKYMHPFNCARFYAVQLLYHRNDPGSLYRIAQQAREFYATQPPTRDAYQMFPCFELVLAEALVLTGQMMEALFYIGEGRKKKTDYVPPAVDTKMFNSLDLYEAIAYLELDEAERAKKILKKIRPGDFYFLSRNYLTILLSIAEAQLSGGVENLDTLYREKLISQTGFTALNNLFTVKSLNKKEQSGVLES